MSSFFLLLLILASVSPVQPDNHKDEPSFPTTCFHLIPHSHCDAGYKKTWEEYYRTEVRLTLNSVTRWLTDFSNSRFLWSEMIFLHRWFEDDTVPLGLKQNFRELVFDGKIEIVNGGYVMHDEAITRYESQIAQTVLGHDLLRQMLLVDKDSEREIQVKTGYQIDPFGSSSFTPTFLKSAGYDVLILNRIPQSIKEEMKRTQGLEFWWFPHALHDNKYDPSSNQTKIFVHVYDDHYETPCCGFDWEDHLSNTEQTPPITTWNVAERSDLFVSMLMNKTSYYRTSHVLIPFGQDFRFQNASLQFSNMDQIVQHVNENRQKYIRKYNRTITLRYSTIRQYSEAERYLSF